MNVCMYVPRHAHCITPLSLTSCVPSGNNVEYNRHFYIQIITNVTDFPLKDDRGYT